MGIFKNKSWKRKFFYTFILCSTFLWFIMFSAKLNLENVRSGFFSINVRQLSFSDNFSKNVTGFKLSKVGDIVVCKIPSLNPWDPLIVKGIKHPKNLSCEHVQPFMTYIDDDGYLRINETEKNKLEIDNQNFTCYYYMFDRKNDTEDGYVDYGDERILKQPTKLESDFVEVKCVYNFTDNDDNVFYGNLHAHPSEKNGKTFAEPKEEQLSLLMIVLDSVSNSALQRNLPLTFNYTTNVMGMKYLKGFNKIGDNSFPNQMAMLMGKRVNDDQKDMLREMKGDYSTMQYDSWPLIWKLYSEKGYATVFNEDNPHVGLFHFGANGFAKKPVDYYYHTFWKAVQTESNQGYTCFRNEPKSRLILDITRRHAMSMKHKLQFIYTSTMELSHDNENQVELLDDDFRSFWQKLYEGNYLNNTAVIFVSDHGLRTGWIRTTLIGLLEERLPFLGIWFPTWFFRKYPKIKAHLEQNAQLLSSSFDVHETLKDILTCNYGGRQRLYLSRGQSHLYPLPKNRTCHQAGIPDHYCTCSIETSLDLNETMVVEGANWLVNRLNDILKNVSDICSKIQLTKTLYATLIDVDEKVKKGIKNLEEAKDHDHGFHVRKSTSIFKQIRMGIETYPHRALFEALLQKEIYGKKRWSVSGTISRFSTYRGLSDCIHDRELRKYCSCKNVLYDTSKNRS